MVFFFREDENFGGILFEQLSYDSKADSGAPSSDEKDLAGEIWDLGQGPGRRGE